MDEPITVLSVAPPADRYRTGDLMLFPAGSDLVLTHTRDGQTTRLLPRLTADLLLQCRDFQTLDEHVRAYCRRRQVGPATLRAMRADLEGLARDGFLIAQRSVVEAARLPPEDADGARIAVVAVPTSDRLDLLRRNLAGFIQSCRRFERDVEFVVTDDSASPKTRAACRRMLGVLSAERGVRIAYAGLEEKLAFAAKIAEVGPLPPEVIHFACVGDNRYGLTTVGANRNALLLHAIGDLVFSVDDDVVCHLAPSPGKVDGVSFSSQGSPMEVWFYPNREKVLRSVDFVERDILALHEQWLGRAPRACLNGRPGPELRLDEADPALLRRLRAGTGKIVVTLNGTIGDCAWDNPDHYLFQRAETFGRLTRSEDAYRVARSSREIVQAANRVTITNRADALFATCIALDDRDLLPPFTPVGRAEDVAFGTLLSRCFGQAYAAHIPWVLLHAPAGSRSFADDHMFSVGFNAWIPSCISRFDPGFARTPTERLSRLGTHLEEIGGLPPTIFAELARLQMWESMSALITGLEERIHVGPPPPAYWLEDARAFVERARLSVLTPVDELYALPGGRKTMQALLVQFGTMLTHWPTIIEAARGLRASGVRLAQPV
jgi:hypothetical protein